MNDRGERLIDVAVAGCGVFLAAFFVFYVGGWGSDALRQLVTDGAYLPPALLAVVAGVHLVRAGGLDPRARRAWSLITASYVCQLVAHSAWFVEDNFLGGPPPYPAVADYGFLAFIPFMLAGLLLLPGVRRTRTERTKLAIDSLIVGTGTFMVLWYLVIGPSIRAAGATGLQVFVSSALPVGDLLLVLALASTLLRRRERSEATLLLAGAVALYIVADVAYSWITLNHQFTGGTWPDLFWLAGNYVLALAARRRHREGRAATHGRAGRARLTLLPYAASAIAYGLLGYLAREQDLYPLGGMIIGAIVLTSLVVARQMYALRENRNLAVTDPLTGLANRTLVGERLTQLVTDPPRDGRTGAVMLIDLDRFKPINDAYGHEAGDAVLTAVATALRSVLRPGDTAGRLGGDEFAVVFPGLPDRLAAERIAERLVAALRTPVIFGDLVLTVAASVGVAFRESDTQDAEELLAHADTAMYAAKRSGRAQYLVYTPELDTRARDAELRAAVERDEFVLHYQPVVDMATGAVTAAEALVRWNHPERGLVMPGEFIDLAEETGAIVPLGEWVLREACRQAAEWRAEIPAAEGIWLTVNLSPQQIKKGNLLQVVTTVLAETGFPADRLVLELTEHEVLEPDEATVALLEQLCATGVSFAVDDFGTGHAAINYLRALPVQVLKIDRSFVAGIDESEEEYAIADAVVALGTAFAMHVVAEGIERPTQAERLLAMGCRYGQGFHFHRPQPPAQLAELLRGAAVTIGR
ncbi:EAL domain-containing protein [Actinoplanes sp. TRM 88003]|uniref:EAL domain-containing protein n=1 Tax=Paractinoplanes aksuensis TaxID=2939490 RepID=A0ABT1E1P2_9ACTN|nr:EAL domain-containing protein [Actinoplanes aksuensis]MCO8277034.1 EAL domain-containing protein [Actinoplanes aksuensis]